LKPVFEQYNSDYPICEDIMTTMLIVILHDLSCFPELLDSWSSVGVPGVTILQSVGGFQAENMVNRGGLGGLLGIFDQGKAQQRTLFSLIDDPELLERAVSEADRVVKGFDRPQSGILFTLPVGQILGLQKWAQDQQEDKAEKNQLPNNEERSQSNLFLWYQDEVMARYGRDVLADWTVQRNTRVSEIITRFELQATIVKRNVRVLDVFLKFLNNPQVPVVCVVNSEGRLMGIVNSKSLSDVMMVPVIPEEFINDPSGYERALKYATIKQMPLVAEIMTEPLFVYLEDTLEKAYSVIRQNKLPGLPVVDKNYRVEGYLDLLEMMAICFDDNDISEEI
jgi:CBS domain-containing protein